MPFVDVDAVESLTERVPLWSKKRLAPARFLRADFIGDKDVSISEAIKTRIYESTKQSFSGQIFLLANWRYFGLQNNPIACYFCVGADSQKLDYIVAEVTTRPGVSDTATCSRSLIPPSHSKPSFQKNFTCRPFTA